jgi:hypothetical protein
MFRNALLSLCLLGLVSPVLAQDEGNELDTITVTGSRVGYSDLLDTPAVSLTKPGDYLLQTIVLSNDSRDAAMRKREIHETIAQLIASAGGRYVVFYVDEYRIALNRDNYRIDLEEDGKRPDTNLVSLQIRVGIGGDPAKAEAIIADMRRFIRGAAKVGRTEIDIKGDTALVMNKPERFRYELIDAIAKDSKRLMDAMALDCKVDIDGLNSRVEWERASAAELLLYIRYSVAISDCRKVSQ